MIVQERKLTRARELGIPQSRDAEALCAEASGTEPTARHPVNRRHAQLTSLPALG